MEHRPIVPEDIRRGDQRRSFARVCASLAQAARHNTRPDAVLAKAWPDDATASRILKAAQSPLTSAGFPQMQAVRVLPMLSPQAASARLFALSSSVDLAGVSTIAVPYIGLTGRPVVPFVLENVPMPIVDLLVSGLVIGPVKKLLVGSLLSNTLQAASNDTAAAIIAGALSASCEQSMDALLFSSTAATAAAPAGILHNVTAIPSAGKTGAEGVADDLGLLAQSIADSGISADDMIVITTPALATKLRVLSSLKFSNEVLSSSSIPTGEVIAVAAGGLVSGFKGAVTVEVSEESTPHMEDTAPADICDSGGTLASPVVSVWQKDALAIKVRGEVAWAVHPGAVALVTGAAW